MKTALRASRRSTVSQRLKRNLAVATQAMFVLGTDPPATTTNMGGTDLTWGTLVIPDKDLLVSAIWFRHPGVAFMQPGIWDGSGGATAGPLLGSGPQISGVAADTWQRLPLSAPVQLLAGQQYAIGVFATSGNHYFTTYNGSGSDYVDGGATLTPVTLTGTNYGRYSSTSALAYPANAVADANPKIFSMKIEGLVGGRLPYAYTGAPVNIVVPPTANSMIVDIYGAESGTANAATAGLGGRLQAIIPVTAGETLQINVGGKGPNHPGGNAGAIAGGWNGGGSAGGAGGSFWGGPGGGATDIRRGAFALVDRIAVAGGGGGSGATNTNIGASGGGTTGAAGPNGIAGAGSGGGGGTPSAGGASGIGGGGAGAGTVGTLGVGGNGGTGGTRVGGGGGGGYYGGGGGGGNSGSGQAAGGGGGGSSYVDPSAVNIVHIQGARTGNGVATVTFSTEVVFSDSTPRVFAYTGAAQTTVVPSGANFVTVDLQGAQGGGSGAYLGGRGGRLRASLAVTPGETLQINVGGRGVQTATPSAPGGWNGGGPQNADATSQGFGGGGATDIRRGAFALADRIAIAGGGGGAGYASVNGGDGGGTTGQAGPNGAYTGGGGGTPSAGGAAGTGSPQGGATAGALGIGGTAGISQFGIAGGGGGGLYGGGGGVARGTTTQVASGAGGGSSYVDVAATNVLHQQGFRDDHGTAILTFSDVAPDPTPMLIDEFTRAANAGNLGTAPDGLGAFPDGLVYSNLAGNMAMDGTRAYMGVSGAANVATSVIDTTYSDIDLEEEFDSDAGVGFGIGIVYRAVDANNFRFVFLYKLGDGTHGFFSGKVEGGVRTYDHLNNSNPVSGSLAGKKLRILAVGNQIKIYLNNVQVGSTFTSTFNQTATKHGPMGYAPSGTGDANGKIRTMTYIPNPLVAEIPVFGLVRKFTAEEQTWQNAAKTTPAAADGDPVWTWGDQAGVSDLVKVSATATLKTNILNGKKVVRFNGSAMDTAGPLFNSNGAAATMIVVSDAIGAGAGTLLSTRAASPGTGGWLLRYNDSTHLLYAHIGGSGPAAQTITDAFHTHVVRRSGGNAEVGSDGALTAPAATTYSTSSPGGTRVGSDFDNSDILNGDIAVIFIWDRALTNTEIDQVLLWINQQYGLAWT